MSWSLVKYVLTGAVRDKIVVSLLLMLVVGISLAIVMGSAAVIEKAQFATVFASGGLRLAAMAGLVLFIVFFVRRSFDAKDVEFLLSRPLGRVQFLVSFSASFCLLAIVMGLAVAGTLLAFNPAIAAQGFALWALSLVLEYMIMVNAALFFSMILSSAAVATMVTFAFYALARMMGQILGIIDSGISVMGHDLLKNIMEVISLVTPRFDLMGQTSWLIYGVDGQVSLMFVLSQGLLFTGLFLLAALIDFLHRQF